ncbi:hypothetical protein F5Y10DRAFT_145672 [Nemania abortiva]|nr:hypothetical protein F5Y10DRAFT_145672 [Nemania abortiva]
MADLSLGKIQAALASATNEVTVAAANLNFDFTLVKFEAPPEYQPLSTNLTKRRKDNAEHGDIHVTARRLSALFEGVCPGTPNLIKAYGRRVSEISEAAKRIPSNDKSGMFEEYLGIDATSIWAAATSSQSGSAIQIHLLACLLARMWSHAEAVSIWDRIVTSRRHEIAGNFQNGTNVPFAALAAATQQEIRLSSLQTWDTSARSWLKTADFFRNQQQTQFSLIWKNLSLPVNNETDPYRSVMVAWSSAVQIMDKVIGGAPYDVHDGAILLAISSWHIYPDLLVFGGRAIKSPTTEVLMMDDLVAEGGVLSLGLSRPDKSYIGDSGNEKAGVSWSIPLDRLKYYGRSVRRTRTLLRDGHRLTLHDLLLVNLGAILGKWRVSRKDREYYIAFIIKLVSFAKTRKRSSSRGNDAPVDWMDMLLEPALSRMQVLEKADFLLDLGSRRRSFIEKHVPDDSHRRTDWPENFGLCDVNVLQSILTGDAANASFLLHIYHQNFRNIPDAVIVGISEERTRQPGILQFWVTEPLGAFLRDRRPNIEVKHIELSQGYSYTLKGLPDELRLADDVVHHILVGDPRFAAIYYVKDSTQNASIPQDRRSRPWNLSDVLWCLESNYILQSRLKTFLEGDHISHCRSHLCFLGAISELFSGEMMEGSSISSRVLDRPLLKPWKERRALYTWTPDDNLQATYLRNWAIPRLNRNQVVTVLCYLETGCVGIQSMPDSTLNRIFGFAVDDSMLVTSELLRDPYVDTETAAGQALSKFSRLLGNVGKPGLTLFSTPSDLMIADRDPGAWKTATFAKFDGNLINCFQQTSIHLKMLEWTQPFHDDEAVGQLTVEVHLIEAVVSVHDRGVWLGDIDIPSSLSKGMEVPSNCMPSLHGSEGTGAYADDLVVALDTWDEVLDCPQDGFTIIRSQGNWIARLAIIGMLAHHKAVFERVFVCQRSLNPCWHCTIGRLRGQMSGREVVIL